MTDLPPPEPQAERRAPGSGAVGWHAVWLGLITVAAAAHYWWLGGPGDVALAAMTAPALAGLFLSDSRRLLPVAVLLLLWAVAGGAAAALTGGVTGPLAIWCLTPLAAAAVSRPRRGLPLGAALSAVSAGAAAIAEFTGHVPPAPTGIDAALLSLLSLSSLGLTLGAGMILAAARRRREAFQTQADLHRRAAQRETLLELVQGQPQLLLTVDAAGAVLDAAGPVPAGLDLEQLRTNGLTASAAPGDREALARGLAEAGVVGFAPNSAMDRWLEAVVCVTPAGHRIAAISDRTRQRAREAALEQARVEAENLNAGKSRFLANMSHELRTPLNAIIGFSDVMRTGMFGQLTPKYAEYAGMIHESGGHLLDLINDVLDMSKIEAERFELSREEFDAREAVSAALRLMRLQADEAGVQLRGVLANDPLNVYADRRALKQIILNLVSNALKFTGRGGQVTVVARAQAEFLELSVADTGMGISSEDLARLGRPFEQAGGMQQRSKGTGLGLSLVRAFAELHGGVMSLESSLGEGTAVTVRLPVILPARAEDPPPPPPRPPEPTPPPPPPTYPSNVVAFDPRR